MQSASHKQGKLVVSSVLKYISGMITLAMYSNDRNATNHFKQCWCLVWRAFYGGYELPLPQLSVTVPTEHVAIPAAKPAWFIAKFSKPLRRVIGRTVVEPSRRARKDTLSIKYDILECSHKLPGNEMYGIAAPAKHRRCAECAPLTGVEATPQSRLCNGTRR